MPHDVTQKRNTGNVGTADSSPPPTINHRMRTAMVLFELEQALGRYVADIAANPEDIPESMRQEVLNRKHGPQGAGTEAWQRKALDSRDIHKRAYRHRASRYRNIAPTAST